MPSGPRIVIPGVPVFVTSRMTSGLPLTGASFLNLILQGIIARALSLFGLEICHIGFMTNHVHMMAVPKDPDKFCSFMNTFKTEVAHMVNRLLGEHKRKVWEDSFDCLPVLTHEDVMEKIVYLYLNPVKAGLVESVDDYPGFTSWSMFCANKTVKKVVWIKRSLIQRLNSFFMSIRKQEALRNDLEAQATDSYELKFEFNAWMPHFGITDKEEQARINQEIIERIRAGEAEIKAERAKEGKKVVGAKALILQRIDKKYKPKKHGKRAWCICRDIEVRANFINYIKYLRKQAHEVRQRWIEGYINEPYPLGMLPPRYPRYATVMPSFFDLPQERYRRNC